MMTASVEPLLDRLDELKPMLPLHWEELGIYKDKMPLDPDWESFRAIDAKGALLCIGLRADGRLVGSFVGSVGGGLHYRSTLTCKMDLCFVLPEFRGGGGTILFEATKAELKRRGVKLWWVGSKSHHPIEGFYEFMGFELQETYHTMWLGNDDEP